MQKIDYKPFIKKSTVHFLIATNIWNKKKSYFPGITKISFESIENKSQLLHFKILQFVTFEIGNGNDFNYLQLVIRTNNPIPTLLKAWIPKNYCLKQKDWKGEIFCF